MLMLIKMFFSVFPVPVCMPNKKLATNKCATITTHQCINIKSNLTNNILKYQQVKSNII